ncbi:Pyruvate dehydrogenase (cytochrome) [Pseudonocardia dioxanivorans CB1190]|uniref:Pyruvate dehydrogenase [ubiquinone] n=1 Tax=Pseudonocardia dioxanivorans (strain ATCC 55486 / DSM 44775 / JCM 13855 / CB1190) TaxID=675635 RepID=F4CZC4_PSEUX|nr:Pyruvate dehydrogenase (cytochrome) [Pseudonocardia dioxanivorans CB1190]
MSLSGKGSPVATTCADYIVAALKASGVRRVYGIPGDSLNGFTDALRRDGQVTWQHVRHEEAAAFAAAGEAAVTGEMAVTAASCGPGSLHLVNGLWDAGRSRVPVLAIAAHIPRGEIGSGYFQETHPQDFYRELSVYSELISVPEQVPRVLEVAMRTAITERGVAVVVIPGEVFLSEAPANIEIRRVRATTSVVRPRDDTLAAAAEVLNSARAVTVLAGAGVAGSHCELIALAATLKSPIVHALRGKEFVEFDNPYDVGMTGLIGYSSGYRAMEHCDTLLMLGTDFPYRPFYPPVGTPIIQVDVRGEIIGRRAPVTVSLVGTVTDTVRALLPLLEQKSDSRHLDTMVAHYQRARRRLDALAMNSSDRGGLHPQLVAATIDRLATDDAVFAVDVGTPTIWAARYLHMNGERRLVGSFTHASMANALPQAIGAQASAPDRQVIAMAGDGGLAMMLGELLTLRQQRLPVKVVVFNNGALAFVEMEMKAAGIVNFGTDLENPDFAGIATAAGLFGVRVDRAADLEGALSAAFAYDGPALVDVRVARQELALPPKITLEQLKGFALYTTRTILSGGGDEIIELARTNLSDLRSE